MIVLVDNYDSFTFNLYQMIAIERDCLVLRNDEVNGDAISALGADGIVISPGPGVPEAAGNCLEIVKQHTGSIPILGICLGHQVIATVFGAEVKRAPTIVHGKSSEIVHHGDPMFRGVPSPFTAARYHSLMVDDACQNRDLIVTAETTESLNMGIRVKDSQTVGVQFHPESFMTPFGRQIITNFLEVCHA